MGRLLFFVFLGKEGGAFRGTAFWLVMLSFARQLPARQAAFFSTLDNSPRSPAQCDALGRRAAEGVPDSQSASEQGGSAKRERALRTRLASSGGQLTKRTEQGARRAAGSRDLFRERGSGPDSGKPKGFPRHPAPGAVGRRDTCQDCTASSSKRCPGLKSVQVERGKDVSGAARGGFKASALASASVS